MIEQQIKNRIDNLKEQINELQELVNPPSENQPKKQEKDDSVKIIHGVCVPAFYLFGEKNLNIYRSAYYYVLDKTEEGKYYSKLKKEDIKLDLPHRLEKYIDKKWKKWFTRELIHLVNCVPFTLGIDKETGIQALALTHPNDNYNKKVGRKIVKGRIARMKRQKIGRKYYGSVRRVRAKGYLEKYYTLYDVPEWMYIPPDYLDSLDDTQWCPECNHLLYIIDDSEDYLEADCPNCDYWGNKDYWESEEE
jgi:hypothetical protein